MSTTKGVDKLQFAENEVQCCPTDGYQSPTDRDRPSGLGHKQVFEVVQNIAVETPLSRSFGASKLASWKTKLLGGPLIRPIAAAILSHDPRQDSSHDPSQQLSRPWRATFFRFGPLSGIFGMLLAMAGMMASLGILAGSDGSLVADWSAPPSTYLAIFTALANVSMRYAVIHGVVIAWWLRALKGSTLAALHNDWRSGTTLLGALTSGRRTGLLGLACIFSTFVVIDGPLLQRASTVVSQPIVNDPQHLEVTMAPEIPTAYTGVWGTAKEYQNFAIGHTPAFNGTVPGGDGKNVSNHIFPTAINIQDYITESWLTGGPLFGVVKGCPGVCSAKVRAPAFFPSSCTFHELPSAFLGEMDTSTVGVVAPPLDHAGLFLATNLVLGGHEAINLVTGYADTPDCTGNITYKACTYESAIGEYDVIISNGLVEFQSPEAPMLIAIANNTPVDQEWSSALDGHRSTLGGVASLMYARWDAFVDIYTKQDGDVQTLSVGGLELIEFEKAGPGRCVSFRDPHEKVYASLNILAVNIGWLAASHNASYALSHMDDSLRVHTTVVGSLHGSHSVFHTDYWYFLVAVLVEFGCICLVAPTYWGWWRLGRSMSFSPLEIAKAFDSPLLANVNSNSSGHEVVKAVGETQVKYGAVRNVQAGGNFKLGLGHPELVEHPGKGMRFEV